MRKIICIKSKKYKKIINPKLSYICYKTLLLSNVCNKCESEDEKIFVEQESVEMLKVLDLINNIEKYKNK